MKSLFYLLLFLLSFGLLAPDAKAQTTLAAGDIAIVGYNSDQLAGNDNFSFLLLTNVSAGTTINFTDFGWCSDINGFQTGQPANPGAGAKSDGAITWTATSALPCGTQVTINCEVPTTDAGSVTGLQNQVSTPSLYMTLATEGDQIFAFQGTLGSPSLITGMQMDGPWAASLSSTTFTAEQSALPPTLNSTNSLFIDPEVNNAVYNCTITSNSPANLRAAIFNTSNWTGGDATPFALPLACTFGCSSCTAPSVTSDPPNSTICADNNTTFGITATGTGLTYQWQVNTGSGFTNISNGAPYSNATTNTLTITDATAGMSGHTYRCVVTGTCGSATSGSGTLIISSISTAAGAQSNVSCFGGSNGVASVTPSGGISPYTYSWSPSGGTNSVASGLAAGSYTVTVTDSIGCQASSSYTITQPSVLSVTPLSQINVACNGGSTGTAAINIPTGGAGGYTYDWTPGTPTGDGTRSVTGLTAGTWTVTVTDANSCMATQSFTVTQPVAIVSGSTIVANVACNGGANGAIDLTPSGGTPGYTYNWGGGITSEDRTGLAAGNYGVTITDANGCTDTVNVTVTEPAAVSGSTVITNVSCLGGLNGAVNLTPLGGTGPYTYDWGGSIITEDRTGLAAGNYSVTITDANGCTGTINATVTEPGAAVSGTTVVTHVACFGGATGTIDLIPSGGTNPYTYDWGGAITTQDRTNITAGSYSVTITDANGCTETVNATIAEPATAVSGTTVVTNILTCNGDSTGSINLTPSGGTGSYTYNWDGGITAEDRSGIAAGSYSVTITDANGCTAIVSATVTEPTAVSGSTVVTNVSCNGGSNGAIDLTPSGGTGPYTYNWGGSITTEDRTGLAAGSYSVSITDAHSCTGMVNVTVTQPAAVSGTAMVTNVSCFGGSDGAISLTPSGGTAPYTYDWGGSMIASLPANAAPIIVLCGQSNAVGQFNDSMAISHLPAAYAGGQTDIKIWWEGDYNTYPNGGAFEDMQVPVNTKGRYTYTNPAVLATLISGWGIEQSAAHDLQNATGDTVYVIKSAIGGMEIKYWDRPSGAGWVELKRQITNAISYLQSIGKVPVVMGTLWVQGESDAYEAQSLAYEGKLRDFITDYRTTSPYLATSPFYMLKLKTGSNYMTGTFAQGGPRINAAFEQMALEDANNHVLNPEQVPGGTAFQEETRPTHYTPASYLNIGHYWFEHMHSLSAGNYSVIITDAKGCTGTVNATVTEPTAVSGTTVVTNVSCFGGTNGAIDLTPSGGTGPYTYDWSGGITTEDRTGLAAGSYSVTITDANGCTDTVNATIAEPASAVSGTTVITTVTCFGGSDGSIDLTPSGGTGPYTYDWGGGITTEDRTGLAAGSYSVIITDANGCTDTVNATVTEPAAVSGTTVVNHVACNGDSTGSIDLTPSGGTGPYTYNWGGGITTEDRTGLAAGSYSVIITDANGCTDTVNATVTEPTAVSGTTTVTSVICNGGSTGAVDLTPSGGTGPYTYSWGGGITTEDRTGLAAGSYSVTITDANGCTGTVNATVTEPTAVSGTTVVTNVSCFGGMDGSINLTPSGGAGTYTYNWGGGITTEDRTGLAAGSYSVTITDANSCTGTVNATVAQPAAINIYNVTGGGAYCAGGAGVAIGLSNSENGVQYQLFRAATAIGTPVAGTGGVINFGNQTVAGTYTVVATHTITNCQANMSGNAVIIVNPIPNVNTVANQTLCNGASTAAIMFSGAVTATTYSWTNSNTSISLAANGTGNIAAFTATNTTNTPAVAIITVTPTANGCVGATTNFDITVNPTPTVNTVGNQAVCNNAATTTVAFSGAVSGTTYSWTNSHTSIGLTASGVGNIAAFTATNTTNAPVTATITVTPSANGCTGATTNFDITVNPTPTVNTVSNQAVCNNTTTTAVAFSGAVTGTAYSWTNSHTSIGLAPSGTGNIAAFNATNATNTPVTATITVTPTANGCVGATTNFDIIVNPTPTVDTVSNQAVCNNATTTAVAFSGAVTGTAYSWGNNNTSIGLAANGTGNIAAFTATNATNAPVTATITVTPSANGCTGAATNFDIAVNPTPTVDTVSNQAVCNNATTTAVAFSGAVTGTTFSWTNSHTSIGLAASGMGNIATFTATNATTAPEVATIIITPSANGCVGPTDSFTITVNPTPMLTGTLMPAAICNNTQFNYTPISATAGAGFAWTRAAVAGISNSAANGAGNPAETLVNTTPAPVSVIYSYTITANGCSNTQAVQVTINPTPQLSSPVAYAQCSGDEFAYTPASLTTGTAYSWSRAAITGITPAIAGGTGSIKENLVNSTNAAVNVVYVYTLTAYGCTNTQQVTVTVNPLPQAPAITVQSPENVCTNTMFQNFGAATPPATGTTYMWSATNATIWRQSNTRQHALISFPNAGASVASLEVTVSATGCANKSSATINVGGGWSPNPEVIYRSGRFVCLLNNADTYRWGYDETETLDSNIIPNETNQDYLNTTPEFDNRYYWVMVFKDGCMQKAYYNKPTDVAVAELKSDYVKVYPNPAHKVAHLSFDVKETSNVRVVLTDLSGRMVQNVFNGQKVKGIQNISIDLKNLSSGLYMVNILTEQGQKSVKLSVTN